MATIYPEDHYGSMGMNDPQAAYLTAQLQTLHAKIAHGPRDAEELQKEAEILQDAMMRPVEGKRVKTPRGDIFLILDRKARQIATNDVYDGFFVDKNGIIGMSEDQIKLMPSGASITATPPLIGIDVGGVFLVDDGKKRHIANPTTMDAYRFSFSRVKGAEDDQHPVGEEIRAD